jgi:hypothetical protein
MTSFFAKHITHWFAETYVRGFALRKYHLVEAITFLVKNTVEGVKFTCTI